MNLPPHEYGLFITHNEHRGYYQAIDEAVDELEAGECAPLWADSRQQVLDTGELWTLQWYPVTPVGCYIVHGSTLDACLKWAENA